MSDGRGGIITAGYLLIVTDRLDGQGPVITRVELPSPTTRDALAALTLSGTVRDVAGEGVTPSGVNRMFFQLRRTSDGFAYNGSSFTPDVRFGYYIVPLSAATSAPGAIRTYGRSLSFLPPANVLSPGRYSISILAQDNAGNYSVRVVYFTIAAPSVPSASATLSLMAPSAGSS